MYIKPWISECAHNINYVHILICIGNRMYLRAIIKNNCTSNSQVIARGEVECNFDLRIQLFFNCTQIHVIAY